MIPHHLIREHKDAVIDAAHRGALLQLDSLQRLSTRTIASSRQMLVRSEAQGNGDALAAASSSIIDLGSRSLDTYRYFLEITGDACAKWTDLCEEHWRGAHNRMQSAIADCARRVPGEAGMAIFFSRQAEDSAAVATETTDPIVAGSTIDDAERSTAGKRSRRAA